jgi:hypothetical protein
MLLGSALTAGALAGGIPCAPETCCCRPACCAHQQTQSTVPAGDVDQVPCCLITSAPPVWSALTIKPPMSDDDAPMRHVFAIEAFPGLESLGKPRFVPPQFRAPQCRIPVYLKTSILLC